MHTFIQSIVPIDTEINNTKKMNISQLKEVLSSRSLVKTSRKVDLLERLVNAIYSTSNISVVLENICGNSTM